MVEILTISDFIQRVYYNVVVVKIEKSVPDFNTENPCFTMLFTHCLSFADTVLGSDLVDGLSLHGQSVL